MWLSYLGEIDKEVVCDTEHIPWPITIDLMPLFVVVALHGGRQWPIIRAGTDGGLGLSDGVS